MKIEVNNLTNHRISKEYFQKVGKTVLKKLGQQKEVEIRTRSLRSRNLVSSSCSEISLVFVNDQEMKSLNKKYRKQDKTTDVLSFLYSETGKRELSGEIVISIPQANRQAKKQSYPLKRELLTLFIHGILHLVGYDDEREKDYKKMIEKQEEILEFLS